MEMLILNGSPRPSGNTAAMVAAFSDGAREAGHDGNGGGCLQEENRRLPGLRILPHKG